VGGAGWQAHPTRLREVIGNARSDPVMRLSEARVQRAVRQGQVDFSPVSDHRAKGSKHGHHGLLRLMVAGFASGARALRDIEYFGDSLSTSALRAMGLGGAVSDSTLYRQLAFAAREN